MRNNKLSVLDEVCLDIALATYLPEERNEIMSDILNGNYEVKEAADVEG